MKVQARIMTRLHSMGPLGRGHTPTPINLYHTPLNSGFLHSLKMSADSDLATYRERRAALISDDRSYRRDIRTQLSEAEVKAEKVVREIRALEASTIWEQEHPSIPHPFPGMEFLTGTFPVLE